MTDQELDASLNALMSQFDELNEFYIKLVAGQIKTAGEMNPTSMNRIAVMAEMNRNILWIGKRLAAAIRATVPKTMQLFRRAAADTYADPRFRKALQDIPETEQKELKASLNHYAEAVARQTAGTMTNLSNTTVVSQEYRKTVDRAILAASSGLDDYGAAMRRTVRELGENGLTVEYPGGYRRRLDSSVRQSILDGVNGIAQQGSLMMGEKLGYDAVELSAHLRSAPDHEPIQGRVFLLPEFEKMQNGLPFQDVDGRSFAAIRRKIGAWNCMHIAMSFSTERSHRRYTESQLQSFRDANNQGCEIGGKHYTIYQAGQLMRRIETAIRKERDVQKAAKAAGDDELYRESRQRMTSLRKRYSVVARTAGLKERVERMRSS